jgi:hypothetical protein
VIAVILMLSVTMANPSRTDLPMFTKDIYRFIHPAAAQQGKALLPASCGVCQDIETKIQWLNYAKINDLYYIDRAIKMADEDLKSLEEQVSVPGFDVNRRWNSSFNWKWDLEKAKMLLISDPEEKDWASPIDIQIKKLQDILNKFCNGKILYKEPAGSPNACMQLGQASPESDAVNQ